MEDEEEELEDSVMEDAPQPEEQKPSETNPTTQVQHNLNIITLEGLLCYSCFHQKYVGQWSMDFIQRTPFRQVVSLRARTISAVLGSVQP